MVYRPRQYWIMVNWINLFLLLWRMCRCRPGVGVVVRCLLGVSGCRAVGGVSWCLRDKFCDTIPWRYWHRREDNSNGPVGSTKSLWCQWVCHLPERAGVMASRTCRSKSRWVFAVWGHFRASAWPTLVRIPTWGCRCLRAALLRHCSNGNPISVLLVS